MKTIKTKKLPKRVLTVKDFSGARNQANPTNPIGNGTDTTATMTIIMTTINR